jgi:hypothetical protein
VETVTGAQPQIDIAPTFKGVLAFSDLLNPSGTGMWVMRDWLTSRSGLLFRVTDGQFSFEATVETVRLILRRGGHEASVDLTPWSGSRDLRMHVMWSPTMLEVGAGTSGQDLKTMSVTTPSTFPPLSVIRYARAQKMLPTTEFESLEAFRQAVHELWTTLRDDQERSGSYNAFWDQSYDGARKAAAPTPKREVDIQPTLHRLFSEWALLRSVEVFPEAVTGAGNLDFALVASVRGQGPMTICVEVKLAHSADVLHGLKTQLPLYMERKRCPFGVYVVLWFKGQWFDRPTLADIERVAQKTGGQAPTETPGDLDHFEFALRYREDDAIRVYVIDVSKPETASKA